MTIENINALFEIQISIGHQSPSESNSKSIKNKERYILEVGKYGSCCEIQFLKRKNDNFKNKSLESFQRISHKFFWEQKICNKIKQVKSIGIPIYRNCSTPNVTMTNFKDLLVNSYLSFRQQLILLHNFNGSKISLNKHFEVVRHLSNVTA